MKKLLTNLLCLTIFAYATSSLAQKISIDSPEFKQLQALGYELDKQDAGLSEVTVLTNGSSLLNLERNELRLAVWRSFTRKKLNTNQEIELLQLANKMNILSMYQVSIKEGSIDFGMFIFGPYSSKALATVVRQLEKSYETLEAVPEIYKLLNN